MNEQERDELKARITEAAEVLRSLLKQLPPGHDRTWALKHLTDEKCLGRRRLTSGAHQDDDDRRTA